MGFLITILNQVCRYLEVQILRYTELLSLHEFLFTHSSSAFGGKKQVYHLVCAPRNLQKGSGLMDPCVNAMSFSLSCMDMSYCTVSSICVTYVAVHITL